MPSFLTVPSLTVTLDSQTGSGALDHEVDPIPIRVRAHMHLRSNSPITPRDDASKDISLELRIAERKLILKQRIDTMWIAAMPDQLSPKITLRESLRVQ
jgi:hypothetical protein